LKNSFQRVSQAKFVCQLLIILSPQALKFAEITALVFFEQPRLITPAIPSSAFPP
jgi:hypothetical protein